MPKEDRRVQKTKAAIITAFIDLLEEQDFNKITINDIADRANVNRGTIYFHYADKYDLLNKCIEGKMDLLQNLCEPINIYSLEDELTQYFKNIYSFFDNNYKFFSLMIKNGGTNQFQERFKKQILSEIRRVSEVNQVGYDGEFFVQFRVNALVGVVEWWIRESHPLSVEEMAKNTTLLFIKNK